MCDLDTVSAGSLPRPVITVQLDTRVERPVTSDLGVDSDPERNFARSPVSSFSSREEEEGNISKQDSISPLRRPRSVSLGSTGRGGLRSNKREPFSQHGGSSPRLKSLHHHHNDNSAAGIHARSLSMNYPAKPKIVIKRSATIELANAWASDSELESGLESDASTTGLSRNPSQEWAPLPDEVWSEDCRANDGRQEDGAVRSPSTINSMIQCSPGEEITSELSSTTAQDDDRGAVADEVDGQPNDVQSSTEDGSTEERDSQLGGLNAPLRRPHRWSLIRRAVKSWSPFVQVYRRRYPWVQLAGHQGNFLPADGGRIRKKACEREVSALMGLMDDKLRPFVPQFFQQVEVEDEKYIEMEDLLAEFDSPAVMDIKMGVRTYLEEELTKARKSPAYRQDLYEKMISVDPDEPTAEEHERHAVTKPRYMQFRENASSSSSLGFRIEGIKLPVEDPRSDFKKVRRRDDVAEELRFFLHDKRELWARFLDRLRALRSACELSNFFYVHEIIGSSLLFVGQHSNNLCGVWVIDFGKTSSLPAGRKLDHRSKWQEGNREDGYLWGLDNLIDIWSHLYDDEEATPVVETAPSLDTTAENLLDTTDGTSSKPQRRKSKVESAGYSTEV